MKLDQLYAKLAIRPRWTYGAIMVDIEKEIKDYRKTLAAEGLKYDAGKLRYDLVPPEAIREITKVLTFGAKKYSDRNWELGISYGRVFGACLRHLWAWFSNSGPDPETGLSHLAHAGCCIFFLLTYEIRKMDNFDDRPKGVANDEPPA